MLRFQTFLRRSISATMFRRQMTLVKRCREYSSLGGRVSEAEDLEAAREWYRDFSKSIIPAKLGETSFSRSSGPGGQKVNKTSSKATTTWQLHTLLKHVPKVLHQGIRDSRYYVLSSDSISIQCDAGRSQTANKEECHTKLHDEIEKIYKKRVPGIISPEQKQRIADLKKLDNTARLKMKKLHGEKKKSRSGGRAGGDD